MKWALSCDELMAINLNKIGVDVVIGGLFMLIFAKKHPVLIKSHNVWVSVEAKVVRVGIKLLQMLFSLSHILNNLKLHIYIPLHFVNSKALGVDRLTNLLNMFTLFFPFLGNVFIHIIYKMIIKSFFTPYYIY